MTAFTSLISWNNVSCHYVAIIVFAQPLLPRLRLITWVGTYIIARMYVYIKAIILYKKEEYVNIALKSEIRFSEEFQMEPSRTSDYVTES